jgi:sugar phosphate isomerase/epimerase
VRTLHHKPYSLKNGFATMVGEDDIDWQRFFALCDENHCVNWHIVEYEDKKYTQLEGVKLCLEALKKMGV